MYTKISFDKYVFYHRLSYLFFCLFFVSFGLLVRILADASGARSRGWYNSWLTNYSGDRTQSSPEAHEESKGKKQQQQQQQDKRRQKTPLVERIFVHILA